MNGEIPADESRRDRLDRRIADAQRESVRLRLETALDGRKADDIGVTESALLADAVVHYINACELRGIAP